MAFLGERRDQTATDKSTCSGYQDSHKVVYIMQSGKMRVTVLGCGTSTGVPLIHCSCKVCKSRNPKNKRLRASIWVQVDGVSLLVDVSPDFRQQALRTRIPAIDAILFTHPHADHVGGIDEIRSYNFIQKKVIPAYAHEWTMRELPVRFPYLFTPRKVEIGRAHV